MIIPFSHPRCSISSHLLFNFGIPFFGVNRSKIQVLIKGILNSGMIEEALRKGALIREGLSSSSRPTPPYNASDLTATREVQGAPETVGGAGGDGLEADRVRSRVGRGDGGDKESSSRKVLSVREDREAGVVGVVAMPPMPAPSV